MSCPCDKKIAILQCRNDKTIQTMSYYKGEDPQDTLNKRPRKCLKCKNLMEIKK